jgi:DNA-directed RNA polymerase subunit M/transcription elongation factor TFIIS
MNFKDLKFDVQPDFSTGNAFLISCLVKINITNDTFLYKLYKSFDVKSEKEKDEYKLYKVQIVKTIELTDVLFKDIYDFDYFKIKLFDYIRQEVYKQSVIKQFDKTDKKVYFYDINFQHFDQYDMLPDLLNIFEIDNLEYKFKSLTNVWTNRCPRCRHETNRAGLASEEGADEEIYFYDCTFCGYRADSYEID